MAVTVAALNATHFLLAGEEHPRGWTVVAYGTQDALMKKVGYRDKRVSIRSTVGGSVRADQAELIEALTAIVSVPEGAGGGGDVDPGAVGLAVNDALKGSPQPIEGQVALPPAVVTAIGSAVNDALRTGGPLPDPAFGPDTAGTITTGGTAQQVLAAAGSPRYIMLTNDGAGDLRLVVGAGSSPSATAGKLIEPGGSFAIRTAEPIYVWGATTGQAYSHSVEVVG